MTPLVPWLHLDLGGPHTHFESKSNFECTHLFVTVAHRKAALRQYLDPKFHYLTRDSNHINMLLLGGNLRQKVNEAAKVSDVVKHLSFNKTPYCPWTNCFRGSQYSGSFHQSNNYNSGRP